MSLVDTAEVSPLSMPLRECRFEYFEALKIIRMKLKVALQLQHLLKRKSVTACNCETAVVPSIVLSHLGKKVEQPILELRRDCLVLAAGGKWVDFGWFQRKLQFGGLFAE